MGKESKENYSGELSAFKRGNYQNDHGSKRKVDCQGNLGSLTEAKKLLKTADHMTYVTYPVIRENKLLLKILDEIAEAIDIIIDSGLEFSKEESEKMKEIMEVAERRKRSPMEFSRKDKVVIMQEDLNTEAITVDDIKNYINIAKNLMKKAESSENFA